MSRGQRAELTLGATVHCAQLGEWLVFSSDSSPGSSGAACGPEEPVEHTCSGGWQRCDARGQQGPGEDEVFLPGKQLLHWPPVCTCLGTSAPDGGPSTLLGGRRLRLSLQPEVGAVSVLTGPGASEGRSPRCVLREPTTGGSGAASFLNYIDTWQ